MPALCGYCGHRKSSHPVADTYAVAGKKYPMDMCMRPNCECDGYWRSKPSGG